MKEYLYINCDPNNGNGNNYTSFLFKAEDIVGLRSGKLKEDDCIYFGVSAKEDLKISFKDKDILSCATNNKFIARFFKNEGVTVIFQDE